MATRIETTETGQTRPAARASSGGAVIERFYAGEPARCPVGCGGRAELVRTATLASGAGELWLECVSCAQRERYEMPVATAAERGEVAAAVSAGRKAQCPRHAQRAALQRRGSQLVCPACGVRYRE